MSQDDVNDCLSSWFTATHQIERNELITDVYRMHDGYIIKVEKIGKEKEKEDEEEVGEEGPPWVQV